MKYFFLFSFGSCVLSLNLDYFTMETNHDVSLRDCLEIVINNYFKNEKWISVVDLSDDEYFLPKIENVLLRNSENFTKASFVEDNVIIIMNQNNIENILKKISRNFRTKFIVVTNSENILNVINSFWKLRILSLLILIQKKNVIEILTYSPFRVQNCSELTTPKLLNKYNRLLKKLENPWVDLKNSDYLNVDFMKCPLNISFMDFPPFIIRDKKKEKITHLEGIEGNMMTAIASKLNFTPEYVNRHESEWGKFEPKPSGLLGDLYTGRSDIGFGVLFPFPERYVKLDGAIAYNLQEVTTWVVPVGAGSDIPVWLANILSEFTILTWIYIVLTFISSILFFKFFIRLNSKLINEKLISSPIFFLISIFIGQSQFQLRKITNRYFVLSWIWFSFVIMSVYQSSMSSKIIAPSPAANIKTFEELLRSKFEMTGPFLGLMVVKSAAEDEEEIVLKKIYEISKPINISINDALLRIANERNMAYFHHVAIFEYFEAINRKITGKVYVVDEGVFPHYPAILFPKHSFLVEYVNKIIGKLNDAGLVEKWTRDFKLAKFKSNVGLHSLNIGDTFGAFLIIIIGWSLGFFIFILELLMGKVFTREIRIVDKYVTAEGGIENEKNKMNFVVGE